jgi:hypothetical protein
MGIGAAHTITLEDARNLATMNRKLILEGKDPLTERNAGKAAAKAAKAEIVTFEKAAETFLEKREVNGRTSPTANSGATRCATTSSRSLAAWMCA